VTDTSNPESTPPGPVTPVPEAPAEATTSAASAEAEASVAPTGAAAAVPAKSALTLWALIAAIVAMVCAIIPGLSFIAFIPAIAAFALGLFGLIRKAPGRGKSLTGVIVGPVALLVAIVVSVGVIAGPRAPIVAASATKPGTSETQAAKPTPTDEPTPEAPAVPADIVYSGSGDSILPIQLPDGAGKAVVATLTHDGSSNFAVWSLDHNLTQTDLIVNTIGAYSGTVLFNVSYASNDPESLEITADGNWTVTVRSILSLRAFTGNTATGTGDDVVLYYGDAGPADVSHDGSSNFTVWLYGDSTDLVVNEIGAYTGTVRWTAGPAVAAITADGNWGITVK
jgi:hypothetical protein